MFKRVCEAAGTGDSWTPRELRTTFVSLLSHRGVSIEEIAHLAGHASTRTTEIVYRRELRPVITTGAEIMDQLFSGTSAPACREPPRTKTQPAADPGYLTPGSTDDAHPADGQPVHATCPFGRRHQLSSPCRIFRMAPGAPREGTRIQTVQFCAVS